jgi:SAM-dependent methyltransferase
MPVSGYRLLADYYDRLFEPHRRALDRLRRKVLGKILPRVTAACDLACGTGSTAVALARRGIRTYAVDASPAMCRLARRKARQAGVRVRVWQADMRAFHLPEAVDLVTCEFDALNHVPRKSDLDRVARAVARALRPGGHFYFDVNDRQAFEKVWPGTWWSELPGVAMVIRGGYDRRRRKGWTQIEWFLGRGRAWRRSRERLEEVAWTPAEIRQSLRRAGFTRIQAWDEAPFWPPAWKIAPGFRTTYLARKAMNAPAGS